MHACEVGKGDRLDAAAAGNPFAVFTAVVAPAILTNARSVLAVHSTQRAQSSEHGDHREEGRNNERVDGRGGGGNNFVNDDGCTNERDRKRAAGRPR